MIPPQHHSLGLTGLFREASDPPSLSGNGGVVRSAIHRVLPIAAQRIDRAQPERVLCRSGAITARAALWGSNRATASKNAWIKAEGQRTGDFRPVLYTPKKPSCTVWRSRSITFARSSGITALCRAERCYADPHQTPGSCGAFQKTLAATGIWRCCRVPVPVLRCE